MAIPTITNKNILRVKKVFDIREDETWSLNRSRTIMEYMPSLTGAELWLINFVRWNMFHNPRWLGVADFTSYYPIPCSKKQTSTFEDFLRLLVDYSGVEINYKTEAGIIRFLTGCTAEFRGFYELLMQRRGQFRVDYHMVFKTTGIAKYFDSTLIDSLDVYGERTRGKAAHRYDRTEAVGKLRRISEVLSRD